MVRKAVMEDLDHVMEIYGFARGFMARNGNPTQWGDGYPIREQIEEDIVRERLFLVCDNGGIAHGVFAFVLGDEPCYAMIDGAWLNDRFYGTIHRLAGDGAMRGIFSQCLEYCRGICPNIRADTHMDNHIVQHLLESHGFTKCGTVNLDKQEGNTLRIAYQLEG